MVIAENYLRRPTFLFAGPFGGIKESNNGVLEEEISWDGLGCLMLWEPDPAFFQTNLPKGGGGGEATCKETANDPHLQACLTSLVKPVPAYCPFCFWASTNQIQAGHHMRELLRLRAYEANCRPPLRLVLRPVVERLIILPLLNFWDVAFMHLISLQ